MTLEHAKIEKKAWGKHTGKDVFLFRLHNKRGAYVELTNYGATLVSVYVPDKSGTLDNVVLGFPTLEGYVKDSCYIGSTIGRMANRIGGASFVLDNQTYQLDRNDGMNNNHGGNEGFHKQVFDASLRDSCVVFTYSSPHGEGGFPGNLVFRVIYSWSNNHELSIQYAAITDLRTVCNFTNHAYFNLSAGNEKIGSHKLQLIASRMLETTADYIPTGKILPANGSAFTSNPLQDKFSQVDGKLQGLNNFYLFDQQPDESAPVCILKHEPSGRKLNVFTSYPGLQLYTGDYLKSEMPGLHGPRYEAFDGVCLECQHYPDSPNHNHFPSVVLNPGQEYNEFITYQFGVERN